MMNVLALCLAFTSLFAAEILSPNPEKQLYQKEDVIVKEGHRIIVVETYDNGGQRNTKVSISPDQQQQQQQDSTVSAASGILDSTKEKAKEVAGEVERKGERFASPGDLICDAFGKCKRKIASVATGKANEAAARQREMAREAKETAEAAIARKREMAREDKEKMEGAYGKAKESAPEKVHHAKQMAEEAYERAKESAAQKAHDVKENVRASVDKANDTAKAAKDMRKTMENQVVGNLSEKAKEAKVKTGHAKERVWRAVSGAAKYVASSEVLNSVMGVASLLGFATGYGMCVWVTFVSSYVLAGSLPRQQFALVQSKIYPVYFRAMAYCIGVTLLAHLVGKRKLIFRSPAETLQGYNLVASILMLLFNALYLEPLATKVMFERMKIEKEEGRGREGMESDKADETQSAMDATGAGGTSATREEAPAVSRESRPQEEAMLKMVRLSHRLKQLNTYSSLLNIMTLTALTWHLVYLGQCLNVTC